MNTPTRSLSLLVTACAMWAAPMLEVRADGVVRKNVLNLTPQEITDLRRGVAEMQKRDPAPNTQPAFDDSVYRTSWNFWARIHGAQSIPSHPVAQQTFDRCDHHAVFLAWHRVYLHYFERTLQKAAGVATLTVPYWNYTSGPSRSAALPRVFRDRTYRPTAQSAPIRNPLYVAQRSNDINGGSSLAASVVSTIVALSESSFDVFQDDLFYTPHGAVHCALVERCPVPLMGTPIRAAEDPIFWPHHTNMDRLWNCWRRLYNQPGRPSQSVSPEEPFVFADENGALTSPMSAEQLVDFAESLQVSYEEEIDCAERPVPVPSPAAAAPRVVLGTSTQPLEITGSGGRLRVAIARPSAATATTNAMLQRPQRVLVSVALEYPAAPTPLYRVIVRRADTGATADIGTLSFFGVEHQHHTPGPLERRFDATQLFAQGVPDATDLDIELVATLGIEDPGTPNTAALGEMGGARLRILSVKVSVEQ